MRTDCAQAPAVPSWFASRGARVLALAALMLLLVARMPYAGMHMGLARDLFEAWRIVQGESLPLRGPVLNDTIHLGPVWFYVVAAMLALARSVSGTLLLLGVLASLQIPLAYLVGKALHSRRAGLLFALGLVVPNWAALEWVLPSHPLFSMPLDLAFVLCALRYWRRPRARYLIAMAPLFVLALHAHPANGGLAWIGLALLAWAWRRGVLRLRDVAWAGLLGLLPLLPFFCWDAQHGFSELHGAGSYLGSASETGSPSSLPALFAGIAWGGAREWFGVLLGWPPRMANVAVVLLAAAGWCAVPGLSAMLRDPRRRGVAIAALLATLAVLSTTASIRAVTPYYMVASSWLMLAGLVACGLASLGEARVARFTRAGVVVVALAACLLCLQGVARLQTRGAWPFSWWPLFDVKHAPDPGVVSVLLLPAYAQDSSGRFLCAQEAPSVHGDYAASLVSDYAIAMRIACARSDVHLGGNETGRQHWLGLSRRLFAAIGVAPRQRLGPLGVVSARPLGDAAALLPPRHEPEYPVRLPDAPAPDEHRLLAQLLPGERLAVSNLAFGFAAAPAITVTIDGVVVAPRAIDAVAAIYDCAPCMAGASARLAIDIRGGNHAGIDVVAF